jgi:CHASE2 domain-containing sensor protein
MKRSFPHLLILALVGAGAASGLLSSLVFGLADSWFRLAPRQASGNIVIVAIDRESLDRFGPWPWPRHLHAGMLDRLGKAGARRIAFDLDVSGRTNAADDQALANAIGQAAGIVILPVFRPGEAADRQTHRSPYAPFTLGATLAAVNVPLGTDGRVRRYTLRDGGQGETVPSLASLLADGQTPRDGAIFVDYGIEPGSVPRLSYSDVLDGNFQRDAINGKNVIIGATATELGDRVTVPVHGALPGPLVHALAAESLVQERHVYGASALFTVILAFLLCYAAGRVFKAGGSQADRRPTIKKPFIFATNNHSAGLDPWFISSQGWWPALTGP